MLTVLGICAVCALALVLAAMIVPFKLSFQVSGGFGSRLSVSGAVGVFAGLIGFGVRYGKESGYTFSVFFLEHRLITLDITSPVGFFMRRRKKRAPVRPAAVEPSEPEVPFLERFSAFRDKVTEVWRLVRLVIHDMRNFVRVDSCSADVVLGLGNPALTGQVVGLIYAVNAVLPEPFAITPSWDFSRMTLRGKLTIEVTVIPVWLWKRVILSTPRIVSAARRKKSRKQEYVHPHDLQEVGTWTSATS